ncbi:hypothetical protein PIROE2DRAFT_9180 [Piromyces sp. E2]|nr:hypothetical protein PIROE2DRAFT_9180 [Piromyces sp. E2]|eukprot:OUM64141.1 hypothetical protein PIROE2DRAFT_9180 [Piromyces sp. E2]
MAVKNRKGSTDKKGISKGNKDQIGSNASIPTNKYGGFLALLVLFFAIVYAIVMGSYIYKRGTGKTTSALKREGPFAGGVNMENLKNPVSVDHKEKPAFSTEEVEKLKEVYVDVNGNVQVPPKNFDENINEKNAKKNEEELKQRQKRSVTVESGNAPDETGEMSDYLKNILTRGPSANFVDLLRNKIVILNPLNNDDSIVQPSSFTHIRHRRSINQHLYASGSKNINICRNINTIEVDICY